MYLVTWCIYIGIRYTGHCSCLHRRFVICRLYVPVFICSSWQAHKKEESSSDEERTWRMSASRARAVDETSRSGSAERDEKEEEEEEEYAGLTLTERVDEREEEVDEGDAGQGQMRFRLRPRVDLIPSRDRGRGRGKAGSGSAELEDFEETAGKGAGKDGEDVFTKFVREQRLPSRPGTGKGTRGSWTRGSGDSTGDDSGWQLPPNISGESGPGTKGGLGGEQLRASLSQELWSELDDEQKRGLALLGRSSPWPCYNRIAIRWPDVMWKTFPAKDSGEDYFEWMRRAREEDMELILRARPGKPAVLTLLGSNKPLMADFLKKVLRSCSTVSEEVAHQMNKVVSIFFISQADVLFWILAN